MGTLTLYAIKSSITLALLYLPYAMMLRRETFFRLNRAMLLAIVSISLVVPCINLHIWDNTVVAMLEPQQEALRQITLPTLVVGAGPSYPSPEEEKSSLLLSEDWGRNLVLLYMIGMVVCLLWKLVGFVRLVRFIPSGCLWTDKVDGATVYCHIGQVSPFTWMRSVVIGESPLPSSPKGEAILQHELAHVRMRHSWDTLAVSLVEVLQWFNPTIWMLEASMYEVHEYEADDAVLRRGISAHDYQLLLIEKAVAHTPYPMVHAFRHSQLKNRITMMTKKKSPRWARLKVLYAVPLTLVALGAMASQKFIDKVEKTIVMKNVKWEPAAQQADKPNDANEKFIHIKPGTMRFIVDGKEMTEQEALKFVRGKQISGEVKTLSDGTTINVFTTITPEKEVETPSNTDNKPYLVVVDKKVAGSVESIDALSTIVSEDQWGDIASISVERGSVAKQIHKELFDESKMKGVINITMMKEEEKGEKATVSPDSIIFDIPEVMAEFPGDIYGWLGQNISYPKEAQDKNIEGRVAIEFVIEKDGSVSGVKALRSPDKLLSDEAIRVVKAMPKWSPAKVEGKPVRMRYVLPVMFKLPKKEQAATNVVD